MFQIGQFIEITGPLDEAVLASALERAVAGTDALNLGFAEDTDGPFQYPRPGAATMEVTDLAAAQDPEAQARALMDADLGLPRDAATDQLLHTELIRLAPDRHFFYQRVHHLLLDGYSAVLVLRRVAEPLQRPAGGRRRRSGFRRHRRLRPAPGPPGRRGRVRRLRSSRRRQSLLGRRAGRRRARHRPRRPAGCRRGIAGPRRPGPARPRGCCP